MMLYEYPWPEAQQLAPLLAQALPSSLTMYNHLIDPTNANLPSKVYATFPPGQKPEPVTAERVTSPAWVLLAETASQVRVYVSTEARAAVADAKEIKVGESAFIAALQEWATQRTSADREVLTLGAIHELWHDTIERLWSPITFGKYLTYLAPENEPGTTSQRTEPLPPGLEFKPVHEADIAEVLTFSEVPHKPEYLRSRIPFSTAIYDTNSEPHVVNANSNDRDSSTGSQVSQADRKGARTALTAAVFTHPDGSIGTLHVHPAYRRQGLALAVVAERLRGSHRRALSHVGEANKASRGLMEAMGWTICRETGRGGGEDGSDLVGWARCPRQEMVKYIDG